jgi:hypothetical protein
MLEYSTKRENMHFAVVNRAWTTSETPDILLIINFFCAIGFAHMRKLPNILTEGRAWLSLLYCYHVIIML